MRKSRALQILILAGLLPACAADLPGTLVVTNPPGSVSTDITAEQLLQSSQVEFDSSDFYTNTTPSPYGCSGDALNFYNAFTGNLNPLLPDGSGLTQRPAFIKNVSLDMTDSNAAGSATLMCSQFPTAAPGTPPGANACATLANAEDFVAIPFYTLLDTYCEGAGPISSPDPSVSKLLAGGAYFDIDRTQLGPNENLLLSVTYFPMSPNNVYPTGAQLTFSDQAFFKVHLKQTGQTLSFLEDLLQPRFITYDGEAGAYPTLVDTLAIMAPPGSHVRTDQVILPISSNPSIDQIRLERYSGTGILVSASLYRLGYR
jgi:hypothetical protein